MNEARNATLLTDIKKTHVLAWSEDDAAPRAIDHEGPHAAMLRLGRRWEELDEAKAAGRHEGFDVHGDCEAYELEDGAILVLSWPGNSALWVVKCTVVTVRLELRLELDGVGKDDPLDEATVRRFLEQLIGAVGIPDGAELTWSEKSEAAEPT
jgi:hypothetical protein